MIICVPSIKRRFTDRVPNSNDKDRPSKVMPVIFEFKMHLS